MQLLEDAVDSAADRTGFSGLVRVERSGAIELAKAYGLADRAHEIRNTIDTQFAIASGTKEPDGTGGGEPDRGRLTRSRDDGSFCARR